MPWCFHCLIFDNLKQLVLVSIVFMLCVGWDPRIHHFLELNECARGENRNWTISSGKLTLALQENQKEISSCIISLLKIDPFCRLHRVGKLSRENGVPGSLGKCSCMRLDFYSMLNHTVLAKGPKFESLR